MMGLHFMEKEPFHTVYVHALVRDKYGAKMSKSKGNVIDPLELIDEYGADALRFTLTVMAAQGRDVKLDPARIAGYRNFATKLWNATRFAEMNAVARNDAMWLNDARLPVNRWLLTELTRAAREITDAIASYRFNEAAGAAYRFVWNLFCDWYVELLKPVFMGSDDEAKAESRAAMAFALDEIFKLLHPIMPFITEELWEKTGGERGGRPTLLCHAAWPQPDFEDASAAADINWLIALVSGIRSVRSEMNVPARAVAPLVLIGADGVTRDRLERHALAIRRLARVGEISHSEQPPEASAQFVLGEATACLPLGTLIDLEAEAARLQKELAKVTEEVARLHKKLSNERFVANAPEEVVETEREKMEEYREAQEKLSLALGRVRGRV
jgi:valyl-tRNA synthetase